MRDSFYPNIDVMVSEEAFEMAIAAAKRVGFRVMMMEEGRTAYTYLLDFDGKEHGGVYIKKPVRPVGGPKKDQV